MRVRGYGLLACPKPVAMRIVQVCTWEPESNPKVLVGHYLYRGGGKRDKVCKSTMECTSNLSSSGRGRGTVPVRYGTCACLCRGRWFGLEASSCSGSLTGTGATSPLTPAPDKVHRTLLSGLQVATPPLRVAFVSRLQLQRNPVSKYHPHHQLESCILPLCVESTPSPRTLLHPPASRFLEGAHHQTRDSDGADGA